MSTIGTLEELRDCYPQPLERSLRKSLTSLDAHMRRFISLSPFLCLGTSGGGGADVTPRGDSPGFVHVLDDQTLLIPDWPGNNRLDSLTNLVGNPNVGLLFFIPGVNETLRVNGSCRDHDGADAARALDGQREASAFGDPRDRSRSVPALRQGADAIAAVGR